MPGRAARTCTAFAAPHARCCTAHCHPYCRVLLPFVLYCTAFTTHARTPARTATCTFAFLLHFCRYRERYLPPPPFAPPLLPRSVFLRTAPATTAGFLLCTHHTCTTILGFTLPAVRFTTPAHTTILLPLPAFPWCSPTPAHLPGTACLPPLVHWLPATCPAVPACLLHVLPAIHLHHVFLPYTGRSSPAVQFHATALEISPGHFTVHTPPTYHACLPLPTHTTVQSTLPLHTPSTISCLIPSSTLHTCAHLSPLHTVVPSFTCHHSYPYLLYHALHAVSIPRAATTCTQVLLLPRSTTFHTPTTYQFYHHLLTAAAFRFAGTGLNRARRAVCYTTLRRRATTTVACRVSYQRFAVLSSFTTQRTPLVPTILRTAGSLCGFEQLLLRWFNEQRANNAPLLFLTGSLPVLLTTTLPRRATIPYALVGSVLLLYNCWRVFCCYPLPYFSWFFSCATGSSLYAACHAYIRYSSVSGRRPLQHTHYTHTTCFAVLRRYSSHVRAVLYLFVLNTIAHTTGFLTTLLYMPSRLPVHHAIFARAHNRTRAVSLGLQTARSSSPTHLTTTKTHTRVYLHTCTPTCTHLCILFYLVTPAFYLHRLPVATHTHTLHCSIFAHREHFPHAACHTPHHLHYITHRTFCCYTYLTHTPLPSLLPYTCISFPTTCLHTHLPAVPTCICYILLPIFPPLHRLYRHSILRTDPSLSSHHVSLSSLLSLFLSFSMPIALHLLSPPAPRRAVAGMAAAKSGGRQFSHSLLSCLPWGSATVLFGVAGQGHSPWVVCSGRC